MPHRLLSLLCAALALTAAACGGGDDEAPATAAVVEATPEAPAPMLTDTAAPPPPQATVEAPPPQATPEAPPPALPPPAQPAPGQPQVVQPGAPGQPSVPAQPPAAPAPTGGVTESKEPNNRPRRANGPAAPEFRVKLDRPTDVDWFYFRVKAGQSIDIAMQHVEGDCTQSFALLTQGGGRGELMRSDYIAVNPGGELPEIVTYTAPPGRDGFVAGKLQGDDRAGVGGAEGCTLLARVSPQGAVVTDPSADAAKFLGSIRE